MKAQRDQLNNVNILSMELLPTPREVKQELPLSVLAQRTVFEGRRQVQAILDGHDPRLFFVVGPCSVHNIESALEYARRLRALSDRVSGRFLVIMRVYFEKPRTSVGWKGFINDPDMDDSFHVERGLREARRFLIDVAELGLPAATEALDPLVPQYIGDLITWTAIGARTTESQTHREMSSGLSSPVGFKNGTDGNIDVAINAIKSTAAPHHFLGITQDGCSAVFRTAGNRYAHLVLRGGAEPNYDAESVCRSAASLVAAGIPPRIMVDCSHGNSCKDASRQPGVLADCVGQIAAGNTSLAGFMIESHLVGGQQSGCDLTALRPDQSITDACLGWEETESAILAAYDRLPHGGVV